jgi:hypothetical protein
MLWENSCGSRTTFISSPRNENGGDINNHDRGAIAIVDPFSTGSLLAQAVCQAGYLCVCVLSEIDSPIANFCLEGIEIRYAATIQHNNRLDDQSMAIQKVR